MNYTKILNEEADKLMFAQRRAISMKRLFETLQRFELVKLMAINYSRIDSDEEWRSMGCPDAEYTMNIVIDNPGNDRRFVELF